jgi:hypothetical protein
VSRDSDPTPSPDGDAAASCSACAGIAPRNIHANTRRSSATLHDTISSQNKNLMILAKKFIDLLF